MNVKIKHLVIAIALAVVANIIAMYIYDYFKNRKK
jgi:hypothetical protein